MKLTAKDCLNNKIIDSIIKEVAGGAHRFPQDQADILKNEIIGIYGESGSGKTTLLNILSLFIKNLDK